MRDNPPHDDPVTTIEHVATVTYSESTVLSAARSHLWRVTGTWYVVSLGIVVAAVFYLALTGVHSWPLGALGAVLLFCLAVPCAVYGLYRTRGLAQLRSMRCPEATLRADDAALSMESEFGQATVPWRTITGIRQLPALWLLTVSSADYVAMPLHGVPSAMLDFIEQKVRQGGGTVVP